MLEQARLPDCRTEDTAQPIDIALSLFLPAIPPPAAALSTLSRAEGESRIGRLRPEQREASGLSQSQSQSQSQASDSGLGHLCAVFPSSSP